MSGPPLIAVVGPVEPDLFRAFVDHYRKEGVERFFVAFHFTEFVSDARRTELLDVCHDLVGPPTLISQGPWHETVHSELRDHLRRRAPAGWQVLADIDEFHAYPAALPELIAEAEEAGSRQVGGLLFDRFALDGGLNSWSVADGLDESFPLGGFLTWRLLGGDPCKAVLAHTSARLTLGSHHIPGTRVTNDPLIPVHHFKWRDGILDDLRIRVTEHSRGAWHEVNPAIRTEAGTFIEHIAGNGGRIDVADPRLTARRASLTQLPTGWNEESRDVERQVYLAAMRSVGMLTPSTTK